MKPRVLLVHNRYRERGGEDAVFEAERDLLDAHGHPVATLELDNAAIPERPGALAQATLALETVWSRRAASEVARATRLHDADVVHFHNTFPLVSPAAYRAARSEGAAIVQTLHNYRLVCPGTLLLREGRPCHDCLGRAVAWPAAAHGCYRGSRSQSAVTTSMLALHRLAGTWQRDVDAYIALTEFARSIFVAGGLPARRIEVKPNFVEAPPRLDGSAGAGFLVVGRLSPEKGVETVLEAWRSRCADLSLTVLGDGPLRERVAKATAVLPRATARGALPRSGVLEAMRAARALVLPSLWYEAFPVTLVEAFASGLPVIASRLGALAELVEDGRTGLLVEARDAEDLALKVRWAQDHPAELAAMGHRARTTYEACYTPARNYAQLASIYARAIARRRGLEEPAGTREGTSG